MFDSISVAELVAILICLVIFIGGPEAATAARGGYHKQIKGNGLKASPPPAPKPKKKVH